MMCKTGTSGNAISTVLLATVNYMDS